MCSSAVRASGAELRLRVPPAVLGECVAAVADEPGGFAGGEGELQLALRVATVEQLLRAEDAVARVVSAADLAAADDETPAPHPFPCTMLFISDGIKKLRAVAAQIDPAGFTQEVAATMVGAFEQRCQQMYST